MAGMPDMAGMMQLLGSLSGTGGMAGAPPGLSGLAGLAGLSGGTSSLSALPQMMQLFSLLGSAGSPNPAATPQQNTAEEQAPVIDVEPAAPEADAEQGAAAAENVANGESENPAEEGTAETASPTGEARRRNQSRHGSGFDPSLLSMLGSLGQMGNIFGRQQTPPAEDAASADPAEADDLYSACANCTERCERYIEMMPLAEVRALATTFPVLRA